MATTSIPARSVLFLSCDLTGSTAFKQHQVRNGVREDESPWQKTFLQFYREFPQELRFKQEEMETGNLQFSLWKAVGDELIFTCEITCETEVYDAVRTWIRTLRSYATDNLKGTPLGTKGGAFVATFPGPDSEASIPREPQSETSIADVVDLNREALTGRRAVSKYLFDYFGPSIDTGFRILSTCNPRYFSLSVEVAYALACAHKAPRADRTAYSSDDLTLLRATELKGVWGGRPYPVFAIDLERDSEFNAAFAPFSSKPPTIDDIEELCRVCYSSSDWPFALYLPAAKNEMFHILPKDPLADYKSVSTTGSETVPTETNNAGDLPDSVPLGTQ